MNCLVKLFCTIGVLITCYAGRSLGQRHEQERVQCYAATKDGRLIATANEGDSVSIWLTGERRRLYQLALPTLDTALHYGNSIGGLDFSKDGKQLLVRRWGQISLWDLTQRKLIRQITLKKNSTGFENAELSMDDSLVVVCLMDSTWVLHTNTFKRVYAVASDNHTEKVPLFFHRSNQLLIQKTGLDSTKIGVANVKGMVAFKLTIPGFSPKLELSHDDRVLFACYQSKTERWKYILSSYDLQTGRLIATKADMQGIISSMSMRWDDQQLLTMEVGPSVGEGSIQIRDPRSLEILSHTEDSRLAFAVDQLRYSTTGDYCFGLSRDHFLIYDPDKNVFFDKDIANPTQLQVSWGKNIPVNLIQASSKQPILSVNFSDGDIRNYNLISGKLQSVIPPITDRYNKVQLSANEDKIYQTIQNKIYVTNGSTLTTTPYLVFNGSDRYLSQCWLVNDSLLLTCGGNGTTTKFYLWDTGKHRLTDSIASTKYMFGAAWDQSHLYLGQIHNDSLKSDYYVAQYDRVKKKFISQRFEAGNTYITNIYTTPSSKLLLGYAGTELFVWQKNDCRLKYHFKGDFFSLAKTPTNKVLTVAIYTDHIRSVFLLDNDSHIYVADNKKITVIDQYGKISGTIKYPEGFSCSAVSEPVKSTEIFLGDESGKVLKLNLRNGQFSSDFISQENPQLNTFRFNTPNESAIDIFTRDKILTFDLRTMSSKAIYKAQNPNNVKMALNNSHEYAAEIISPRQVTLTKLSKGNEARPLNFNYNVRDIEFLSDNDHLLIQTSRYLFKYEISKSRLDSLPTGFCDAIKLSRNDKVGVAYDPREEHCVLFDPVKFKSRGSFGVQIARCDFTPDGEYLQFFAPYEGLCYWNLKTDSLKPYSWVVRESLKNSVGVFAFSPFDSYEQLIEGYKENLFLWHTKDSGFHGLPMNGTNNFIKAVAFSQSGKYCGALDFDDCIQIWIKTESPPAENIEHENTGYKQYFKCFINEKGESIVFDPNLYYFGNKALLNYVSLNIGNSIRSFRQFDYFLNRPDLILAHAQEADTGMVRQYFNAYQKRIEHYRIKPIDLNDPPLLPQITIKTPKAFLVDRPALRLSYSAYGYFSKVDSISLSVNDVPVNFQGSRLPLYQTSKFDGNVNVSLTQGFNKIELIAYSHDGYPSAPATFYVSYKPAVTTTGKTIFIGIAVDKYKQLRTLSYPVKDIMDLSAALRRKSKIYEEYLLTEKNANLTGLLALKKRLLSTSINDKVIIAVSGHGLVGNQKFYFATYTCNPEKPSSGGIGYEDIVDLLSTAPARKRLLLIDACNSGEFDQDYISEKNKVTAFDLMQETFTNLSGKNGVTVISAARGNQSANAGQTIPNGWFTFAALEAIKGARGDENKDGHLSINELKHYIYARVIAISGGLQKPTAREELQDYDWDLF